MEMKTEQFLSKESLAKKGKDWIPYCHICINCVGIQYFKSCLRLDRQIKLSQPILVKYVQFLHYKNSTHIIGLVSIREIAIVISIIVSIVILFDYQIFSVFICKYITNIFSRLLRCFLHILLS